MEEDGSIFVCFVCEKEFRQVSLLEDHMKTHGTMPNMCTELPSRKRSSRGVNNKIPTKPPKTVSKVKDCISDSKINFVSSQQDKESFVITNNKGKSENHHQLAKTKNVPLISNGNVKSDNLYQGISSKIKPTPTTVGKEELPSLLDDKTEKKLLPVTWNITKKKTELGSVDDLTRRAMRIKNYILSREENSTKKRTHDENNDEESLENTMMEYDGARESIVMVDSSFFSSGTSTKPPMGPTIMNSEPLGFICPLVQKRGSLGNDSQFRKKRNSFMRAKSQSDSFDVMDNFDVEEGEIGLAIDDDTNKDYSSNCTIKFQGNNQGRGRGRRGRPPLRIKEEDIGLDDSGDDAVIYKEVRPGRRTQPRRESEEDLEYQCLECSKQFRSFSAMKIHSKSHTEDREIHCPYCEEVFPQRYILYEHLINDHEESSSLTCPHCKKIFTRPDSLKSHMVRMHEENGGLNCYVCNKNFPSQGQLEMHVRVHTGERPFKCDICNKGFVQKVHLRTHLRTMHNVTDMPTTPCRLCDAKFDGRATLREHFTTVHNLSCAEYKVNVAKLRKEGKIPEMIPPKVKVVDPSFRYQNIDVSEMDCDDTPDVIGRKPERIAKQEREGVTIFSKRGRRAKINIRSQRDRAPGMGTVMNLFSNDDDMFTPFQFEVDEPPKGRDQEELNIVESAFKVAEEMDQLGETSSTMIVPGEDSSSSGIYYSVPIVLNSSSSINIITEPASDGDVKGKSSRSSLIADTLRSIGMTEVDDEYAQFAAEHAHMDDTEPYEVEEVQTSELSRGSIVKAEPLEMYSGTMESSHSVDMLSM